MNDERPIAVLGLGASGEAAARLLVGEGRRVVAFDAGEGPALEARAAALGALGVEVRLGRAASPDAAAFDGCMVSPGVPETSPWVTAFRARGVPVISELELGWSRHRGRTLAVTGSNGKSTAVKWLAEALAAAGRSVALGGNYGPPACEIVARRPAPEWLVLEVSSFQLETARDFRPDVGVVLNVQPNHLDRHGDFESYRALKLRLFVRQNESDRAIAPIELRDWLRGARAPVRTFGPAGSGADYEWADGAVRRAGTLVLNARGTWFDNPVLGLTAAAVAAALEAAGVELDAAERAARAFRPLAHRTALVGEIGGVRFVDDSKATNAAALLAAVRTAGGPVRLIAGGLGKNEDYAPAAKVLAAHAVKVYLIGNAAPAMYAAWADRVPCELCGDLDTAFARARAEARPGDVVLLSPGCASFDQFSSYAERGERFARLVAEAAKAAKELEKQSAAKTAAEE